MMKATNSKRVLLGVTGGIAAYKSADLCRRLIERGFDVRVVMTPAAIQFVTPLTLQAVSGQPVHSELLDATAEAGMGHIELARWADLVLVAPASADFLARLAGGHGNDLLATLCLATAAPIAVAPAMNQQMWRAKATCDNVERLRGRAVRILGPADGDQACGDVGPGRMLEPTDIAGQVEEWFARRGRLSGISVVVTAGPTREAIDPVRFVSNHSSGKMGYALAQAAAEAGGEVTLVSGPTALACPPGVTRIDVESSEEMFDAVMSRAGSFQIFVAAAAVADYRPSQVASQKMKKHTPSLSLELERTRDILAHVAALESPPFTVGFAAETENVVANARQKLTRKRLDMIAANRVGVDGTGFNADDNALVVCWSDGEQSLPRAPKIDIAYALIQCITERFFATHPA